MKTIVQEIKDIIEDARQIESATGYGECLYHQNRCDSSIRRYKRMEFVKQAEAEFIKAIPGTGGIISAIARKVDCEWNTA